MISLLLLACTFDDSSQDYLSWYDAGAGLDVTEPISFTDEPYGFPADPATGIGALSDTLFPVEEGTIAYAAGDQFSADTDCISTASDELPWILEGVVTLHPRYYFKTNGCDRDSDEKYYGSYFIEDATGDAPPLPDLFWQALRSRKHKYLAFLGNWGCQKGAKFFNNQSQIGKKHPK